MRIKFASLLAVAALTLLVVMDVFGTVRLSLQPTVLTKVKHG